MPPRTSCSRKKLETDDGRSHSAGGSALRLPMSQTCEGSRDHQHCTTCAGICGVSAQRRLRISSVDGGLNTRQRHFGLDSCGTMRSRRWIVRTIHCNDLPASSSLMRQAPKRAGHAWRSKRTRLQASSHFVLHFGSNGLPNIFSFTSLRRVRRTLLELESKKRLQVLMDGGSGTACHGF